MKTKIEIKETTDKNNILSLTINNNDKEISFIVHDSHYNFHKETISDFSVIFQELKDNFKFFKSLNGYNDLLLMGLYDDEETAITEYNRLRLISEKLLIIFSEKELLN